MKSIFYYANILLIILCCSYGLQYEQLKKNTVLLSGPYLQRTAEDSIVIMWETNKPVVSRIHYGIKNCHDNEYLMSGKKRIHEVILSDLQPGKIYSYQILFDKDTSEIFTFQTFSPNRGDMSFIVYGDSRSNPNIHRAVSFNYFQSNPDFVLHTGDLVNHGNKHEEWLEQFFEPVKNVICHIPILPVLGNHEYKNCRSNSDVLFFKYFHLGNNDEWFSFQYNSVRIIGLNSNVDFSPRSEQYKWLVSEFQSSHYKKSQWRVVYLHHPAFTCTNKHSDNMKIKKHLVPLFQKHKVSVVFSGHSHAYERYYHKKVYYIVTGGGGANPGELVEDTKKPVRQVGFSFYHWCEVKANNNLFHIKVKDLDKQVLDSIIIFDNELNLKS